MSYQPTLQESSPGLGDYLYGRFGGSLASGQRAAAPVPAGLMPQLPTEQRQMAEYTNFRSQANFAQNVSGMGMPSPAVFYLHPDQIAAASNELDQRELRQQMSEGQWSEDQFNSLVELTRRYPGVDPGVIEGLAMGGMSDSDPAAQSILESAYQKNFGEELRGQQGKEIDPERVMSTLGPQKKEESQNPLLRTLKGAVRGALAIPMGAAELFSAGLTSVAMEVSGDGDAGETLERLGDEGGGGALAEIVRGAVRPDEDIQLGSGWLPSQGGETGFYDELGQEADAQTGTALSPGEAATRRVINDGKNWLSPGRLVPQSVNMLAGKEVIEPGTKPYNLVSWATDTALQLYSANPGNMVADLPAAYRGALKNFSGSRSEAAREAVKQIAGGIHGQRRTVDSDMASEWLNSKMGSRFLEYVAGEDSLTRLRRVPGLDLKTADALRMATDTASVRSILEPEMGRHITSAPSKPSAWLGAGGKVDKWYNTAERVQSRLAPHFGGGGSGGMLLKPGDLNGVYDQMQHWMRNGRFTTGQMEAFNRKLAALPDQDPLALERLIRDEFDPILRTNVEAHGTTDEVAAALATRRFRQRAAKDREYWIDQYGNSRRVAGAQKRVMLNGEIVADPGPAVMAEYLNGAIPMPDPGEIRQLTAMKGVHKLVNSQGYRKADRVLTKLVGQVWKPAVLLRPAYVLRVGAAEQARIAAAGMDSMMSNPASALAWMLGRKGDLTLEDGSRLLGDAKQFRGAMNRLSTDMKRGRAGWMDGADFRAYSLADDEEAYVTGFANELQMLSEDPVVQKLLADGRDDTIDWFWEGQGRVHREAMMTSDERYAAFNRRSLDPDDPNHVDSADGHIDTLQDIIDNLTGGDTELLDAMRTGMLGDVKIPDRQWTSAERRIVRNKLREKAANGVGPQYVRGTVDAEGLAMEQRGLIDAVMDGILVHPTNKLARSPLFKQSYWDNMMRMAPDMDEGTIWTLKQRARDAKLDSDYLDQLDSIVPKADASDTILDDIDAADMLAKDEALEQTKSLLYDPQVRGNFATLTRNLFPFAEAWLEEFKVWGRVLSDNPVKPGYRLGQSWDFLREAGPGMDAEGRGYFYTDENGEEVFSIPLDFVPGAPDTAQFSATTEGLSMTNTSSFLPGLGPVAQVPAALVINQIPDHMHTVRDMLMDVALPFGGPEFEGESILGETVDRALPAWARSMYTAATLDADNPNKAEAHKRMTVNALHGRLMTGDADTPRNQQEMEKLVSESARSAKWLGFLEALGKGFLPSSPSTEYEMKTKDGRAWNANVLSDYFYELKESHGEQAAVAQMFQQFGEGGLASAMLSQSSTQYRTAMTESEFNWKREHREFYNKYPMAAYHFTEAKDGGNFSFDAYNEAIEEGALIKMPVEQSVITMADRVGSIMYRTAKEKAVSMFGDSTSEDARLWLREQNLAIKRSLHGYDTGQGFQRMEPEAELQLIGEALSEAPDNETTRAISQLLKAHDEANEMASASGVTNYYQSAEAAPFREQLAVKMDEIVSITPEASTVADLMNALMRSANEPKPQGMMTWGDEGFGGYPSPMMGLMGGLGAQQPSTAPLSI